MSVSECFVSWDFSGFSNLSATGPLFENNFYFYERSAKSEQIAAADPALKFKTKSTKIQNFKKVQIFFFKVLLFLGAPWIKPRHMHPSFSRCIMIVSEIQIQVTRVSELNLGHHIIISILYRTKIMPKISTCTKFSHTTALRILQNAFN
jgi:hypothetical protein